MAPPKIPLLKRLENKFTVGDGCWIWTAAKSEGYGTMMIDGRHVMAHRVVYELLVGPIPEGLELDHVKARGCTSRACVNPGHLEPVTQLENTRRANLKTHCIRGHVLNDETTYHYPGRTKRRCIKCREENNRVRDANRDRNRPHVCPHCGVWFARLPEHLNGRRGGAPQCP